MNRSQELYRLSRIFGGTKYDGLLRETVQAYLADNSSKMDELMAKFPSDKQLLENIVDKVKGKSVFFNLKKAVESKGENVTDSLVCLSSLMTHVAIECRESKEYRALLPDLYNKVGELIKHL